MSLLDTTNPEAPTFQTKEVQITVLGGVKLGGLDKLRVTLKVETEEKAQAPIRQNLDLYHSSQVGKLTEQIAGLYELPQEQINETLEVLTSELEQWRMSQLEVLSNPKTEPPILSAAQCKNARKWLRRPNLMERTQ